MSRIIIIKNRKKTYIVVVVLAAVGHINEPVFVAAVVPEARDAMYLEPHSPW